MGRKNDLLARRLANRNANGPGIQQNREERGSYVRTDLHKESDYEAELEEAEQKGRELERKRHRRWRMSTRIANIVLVLSCVYVLFLIYGVAATDYAYQADGTVAAQKLTIQDLEEKRAFEAIYYQYLRCRLAYEEVLHLDYRLGAGQEEPLTIAAEYESLLEEVSDLSIKTDAMEVEPRYSQIKSMLLSWIRDDIAVYLQNMSAAISQNDEETANNALQDKDRVYGNFSVITQNLAAMGEAIKGIDLADLQTWDPDNYVDDAIQGK